MKFFITMMFSLSCLVPMIASAEVNVYSCRQSFLVGTLFPKFTKLTGIKVNKIFASKGLIQKIQIESKNSPADLLLISNSIQLVEAQELGLTQSIQDSAIKEALPFTFRVPCWKLVGTDNPGSA